VVCPAGGGTEANPAAVGIQLGSSARGRSPCSRCRHPGFHLVRAGFANQEHENSNERAKPEIRYHSKHGITMRYGEPRWDAFTGESRMWPATLEARLPGLRTLGGCSRSLLADRRPHHSSDEAAVPGLSVHRPGGGRFHPPGGRGSAQNPVCRGMRSEEARISLAVRRHAANRSGPAGWLSRGPAPSCGLFCASFTQSRPARSRSYPARATR
jgi:hypothetical protein